MNFNQRFNLLIIRLLWKWMSLQEWQVITLRVKINYKLYTLFYKIYYRLKVGSNFLDLLSISKFLIWKYRIEPSTGKSKLIKNHMVLENGFWNFERVMSTIVQNHKKIVSSTNVITNTGVIFCYWIKSF